MNETGFKQIGLINDLMNYCLLLSKCKYFMTLERLYSIYYEYGQYG